MTSVDGAVVRAAGEARELRIGAWTLDARHNELRRDGETVHLEPKATEVLGLLARHAGTAVSREELLSAVWPGVVVGDDALTQAIIKLRKALGDDAHAPKYIETISKRGYRLLAPVAPAVAQAAAKGPVAAAPATAATPKRGRRVALAVIAVISLVVLGAVTLTQMPWPLGADTRGGGPAASVPTVAVLPLANLSGDAGREYFTDGITEDLINALGRFSGVRVMSLGAVQRFKGRPAGPGEIRSALGTRYVVQGSVREAGGEVRVTLALSDGETGAQLWSGHHDASGAQVFDMQDRIVREIVGALHVKLTQLELQRGFARPTESLEAYDLVLQARALVSRTDRAANREARVLLARAAELAPGYAEVDTEIGYAVFQRAANGWVEDARAAVAEAEARARKALAAGDTRSHARAHSLLAGLYTHQDRYAEALAHAEKATELNPSDSTALYWRGGALMCVGRLDEAIAVLEAARRYDPHPTAAQGMNLAMAYYLAGRNADSVAQADSLLVRAPTQGYLHAIRAAAFARMGRPEEARRAAEQVRRLTPLFDPDDFGAFLGDAGQRARVRDGLREAGL